MAANLHLGDPTFKSVAKGLVGLHRLIAEDKGDTPEAESVRDALDVPLRALNEIEKERAQRLSHDLYSASESQSAIAPKPMDALAQRGLNEAINARKNGEWDRALHLLRTWAEYLLPAQLSYLRGAIWSEAGVPEAAAAFFEHAASTDPENANYQALFLDALAKSDRTAAQKEADRILTDDDHNAPVVVARAGEIRLDEAKIASDAESVRLRRELIPILQRALEKLENDKESPSRISALAMTCGLLGFCYEFFGDTGTSIRHYTRGLQAKPNDEALLAARGILSYGGSSTAITDLERAAQLGSSLIWPYLFMAHHFLIIGQFRQSVAMCEVGLAKNGSNAAKSQLFEWRAIAEAELGYRSEIVREAFDESLRLNPSSESATRNQAAFEASLAVPQIRVEWEQKSADAVRRFGLAERRDMASSDVVPSLAA